MMFEDSKHCSLEITPAVSFILTRLFRTMLLIEEETEARLKLLDIIFWPCQSFESTADPVYGMVSASVALDRA